MTLKPGQKQPAHPNSSAEAKETVQKLDKLRTDLDVDTYAPSDERAKQPGNPNKTPPHERKEGLGPMQTAPADIAAGYIAGARSAIQTQESTDAKIKADPRHERDQEVFKMARSGDIGLVPPSKLELASQGATPEEIDAAPQTPEEQVADDMKRLRAAKDAKQAGATAQVPVAGHAPVLNKPAEKDNPTTGDKQAQPNQEKKEPEKK